MATRAALRNLANPYVPIISNAVISDMYNDNPISRPSGLAVSVGLGTSSETVAIYGSVGLGASSETVPIYGSVGLGASSETVAIYGSVGSGASSEIVAIYGSTGRRRMLFWLPPVVRFTYELISGVLQTSAKIME